MPTEHAAKERPGEFFASWRDEDQAVRNLWQTAWTDLVPFLDCVPRSAA